MAITKKEALKVQEDIKAVDRAIIKKMRELAKDENLRKEHEAEVEVFFNDNKGLLKTIDNIIKIKKKYR